MRKKSKKPFIPKRERSFAIYCKSILLGEWIKFRIEATAGRPRVTIIIAVIKIYLGVKTFIEIRTRVAFKFEGKR
jgi:hypothetical protein